MRQCDEFSIYTTLNRKQHHYLMGLTWIQALCSEESVCVSDLLILSLVYNLLRLIYKEEPSPCPSPSLFALNCLLYSFSSTCIICSIGIVAYSCTYCGNESSRLNPAFFMKKGCITSGVASPSWRMFSRSMCRSPGL